ncbi:MAG: CBS domain-containing protein [Cellvibrionaceae bacterium]
MKTNVVSCHVDDNLQAVALLMWNNDCGCIPVVDSASKPIGIVTDRDIAMGCSLNNRTLWDMQAGDIVNGRPLFSCNEADDITGALALMHDHQVRRLPVTDGSGQLCGILSVSDVITAAQKKPGRGKTDKKLSFDQLVDTLKALSIPHSQTLSAKAG